MVMSGKRVAQTFTHYPVMLQHSDKINNIFRQTIYYKHHMMTAHSIVFDLE